MVQDSKEIFAVGESRWSREKVLPGFDLPRQRLSCLILELLGDEWLLVPAFHWRRAYSQGPTPSMPTWMDKREPVPNHRQHNEDGS